ncbi:MAG TPA: DHH family phosphoesterase [Candidatus Bathyarchaeia archaeon]|nr:DHH family phosphoesterase [Candidatus Bathyarchaeia archaeon]
MSTSPSKTKTTWKGLLRSLSTSARTSEHVVLLCHQNADPDAVCSAFALQALLHRLAPGTKTTIACPEGISAPTRQLMENLGISTPDQKIPSDADLAILVDTNALDQLGAVSGSLLKMEHGVVVVDHHHPHPDTVKLARQMIVDESAAAAAEVVFHLFEASKEQLEKVEATALMAALFVETKHFLLARESTFEVAAKLVKAGADPRRLSGMLSSPMNRSERVARLRAAERSGVSMLGNWIVVTSQLGSYQSSAARAFLTLGAHVAFVAGEVKEKVRVNMRATEDFYEKTGAHLARDVAIPLGKLLGGVGGGHPTAAGLTAPGTVEDVLIACLNRLKESIGPLQT